MPAHDWTRVYGGTFHDFHMSWIAELKKSLNSGLLPDEFFALAEQHTGDMVPDVITLTTRSESRLGDPVVGATALAEAPPEVSLHVTAADDKSYRMLRRTIAVRHREGRRLVALIEILSLGNKDRQSHVEMFAEKVSSALHSGVHVLVVDVHPPGKWDPQGMHGAIWDLVGSGDFVFPEGKSLTAAAYLAERFPEAFVEPFGVGQRLPKMPIFLTLDWYISVELENAYSAAYQTLPAIIRDAVEGRTPPEWEQADR